MQNQLKEFNVLGKKIFKLNILAPQHSRNIQSSTKLSSKDNLQDQSLIINALNKAKSTKGIKVNSKGRDYRVEYIEDITYPNWSSSLMFVKGGSANSVKDWKKAK